MQDLGREATLLARVAHDVAQPLNAILAAMQILRISDDRTAVDRAAQVIDRQVQYLRAFVTRVLDDARLHRQHASGRFVRVDTCDIVTRVIEAARILCVQRGLDLTSDVPDRPAWVDGDPVSLQEIVWNLLSNAVRYTPDGGTILVRVAEDGDHVVVTVCDTGIGLEADEIRRIFRPFGQGDSGSPHGAGLGLAIARELAGAHGGSITARSAGRGHGSEFRVTLPCR